MIPLVLLGIFCLVRWLWMRLGLVRVLGLYIMKILNLRMLLLGLLMKRFWGRKKFLLEDLSPKKERMQQKESSWTNIYIKDLDPSITDQELQGKFSQYGPITSCVIMKGDEGGSRGFGFVNFDKHEDALHAVDALQGVLVGGKSIWLGRAQKKQKENQNFEKNLSS